REKKKKDVFNPAFIKWQRKDQLLLSWILATLTDSAHSQVVGLSTPKEDRKTRKILLEGDSDHRLYRLELTRLGLSNKQSMYALVVINLDGNSTRLIAQVEEQLIEAASVGAEHSNNLQTPGNLMNSCSTVAVAGFDNAEPMHHHYGSTSIMASSSNNNTHGSQLNIGTGIPSSYLLQHPNHLQLSLGIKLNTENYLVWESQFTPILMSCDLMGFVDGTKPASQKYKFGMTEISQDYLNWLRQDQILLCWIKSSLSDNVHAQIIGLKTSAEVWNMLKNSYAAHSWFRLELKLLGANYDPSNQGSELKSGLGKELAAFKKLMPSKGWQPWVGALLVASFATKGAVAGLGVAKQPGADGIQTKSSLEQRFPRELLLSSLEMNIQAVVVEGVQQDEDNCQLRSNWFGELS
ncbi:hypothetical protein EJ110_NYTH12920, partial [Nymphaea thermarum]